MDRPSLEWGLIPAVPVPFRGTTIHEQAQQDYARWMANRNVVGVAVWAHTGRGLHLSATQRQLVLDTWRTALPNKAIVAGANSIDMAREAKRGGADALLAFPRRDDPVAFHQDLGHELPVIAFYLYEAAGGVAYDDSTLRAILSLPTVIGIKVATLDSVMTFQRIAAVMRDHPDKLLISGEDRFLGYSLMMGARAALIGMGSALTDAQGRLLMLKKERLDAAFLRLSAQLDAFGEITFRQPMEGYIRRMLWALAAEGVIPDEACDDPWGPPLPAAERDAVRRFVREALAC
ncbi:MAG TPA: dihydrodipicolinate synthase family protein [Gemmatimonadales bacterium]|nr:dihydrodipicolinate synthase family protein [Gemmatimonadales bacterium]